VCADAKFFVKNRGLQMIKKTIVSAALVAAMCMGVCAPRNAVASDGTITFVGAITSQTCTISGGGGPANFTVKLPTVSTSALRVATETAGRVPFSIMLTNCAQNSGNVSTYFEASSTTDASTGNLFNNMGTATHVEIGLLNSDMSAISLGKPQATQNSRIAFIKNGEAALKYMAQYVATNGASTVGSVNTMVTYSMTYQ
jgi:major type 1 subunit fimbrin (pilin)